ncbi:hypothetical protein tb265_07210 [Gemmatimonadetes bacterium T265]|nr:hypothetical protein tb265_07210 [Gemmatimonadetes bacterium T265]
MTWAAATVLTVACASSAAAGAAFAQSATTGAISGQVTTTNGASADGAQVQVVSRQTGARTGALVRENGRYLVQGLEPGPGYTVVVRRIGFAPFTQPNVVVTLGQATRVDARLEPQATVLAAVTTTAAAATDRIISPTKTGVGTTVGDTLLRRLPSLNRNFTDFVRLTPQVQPAPGNSNAASAGGAPARLNNIQIDGANATDVFGLASTGGQPGAQANSRSINLEAVKEYQVLLSPFDVRQGLFAGALINAVTKNGTNDFHGTAVAVTRNEKLGADVPLVRGQKFQQDQYDFSFGGPIVRDKAFFFLAPSFQHRQAPASGPFFGQAANSAVPFVPGDSDVTRFTQLLKTYGINAGSAGAVTNNNPLAGLFSRLDFNLPGLASRLVVRNNYQRGDNDVFARSTALANPTIALSSNSYTFRSRTSQTVAQLNTTTQNGLNNELILSYQTERDRRVPSVLAPQITVQLRANNAPTAAQYGALLAGADLSSQANQLDQNITEFTDNLSRSFGAHTVTIGSQNQVYKIRNLFAQNLFGTYVFTNFDSLAAGNPRTYAVAKDQGAGLEARFRAANFSGYVQDRWNVNPRLNVTYGVRVDVGHFFDAPFYNPVIDTIFGQRTDRLPNNQAQVSPRLGFNWDATGDQKNQLRGGVGTFTGRPSYVFYSNAFGNTGAGVTILNCGNSGNPGAAPAFSPDVNTQSSVCANGKGLTGYANGGFLGQIATVDQNFKNPQSARATLGYDRALTPTLTLTLEGLYSHAIYAPFYVNDNLKVRRDAGGNLLRDRNGRVVYGNIAATGATTFDTASVVSTRLTLNNGGGLIRLTNQNLDYSYTLTGQLDKRFGNGARLTGSYTYGHSYDVQSLTSDVAGSNFRFGRTVSDRPFTDKYLGRSIFDLPHRVLVTGSYTFRTRTDLSVIYDGHSGSAYDYVYAAGSTNNSGDLNADGQQGNDLVYVPRDLRDPNEIRWASRVRGTAADSARDVAAQQAAFDNLIQSTRCLRDARGSILTRNACRNPWQNNVQLSVRQSLPSLRGNNVSLQLDVFNLLNLLNSNWGETSFAGANSQVNLLSHQGQTVAGNPGLTQSQGIFTYGSSSNPYPPKYTSTNYVGSYYQIQLGLRYGF